MQDASTDTAGSCPSHATKPATPYTHALRTLGKPAEQEYTAIIANSDIPTKPAGDAQSRAARRLLRHERQPNSTTAQEIEVAVAELLSDPAQAALAEWQMANGKSSK